MSSASTPAPPRDLGPAVPFPPPLLFVGGLALGVVSQRLVPLPAIPGGAVVDVLGVVLAVLGLGVMYAGIRTFRRFRTAVYPNRPAKLVVDTGVYAYTRNPMYLGMTVFYLGASLVLHTWWVPALLPVVLVTLVTQVIAREERHLRERFPEAYAAYCARVRRWL